MPNTACHSCGSNLFEVVEKALPGAKHALVFVQCASCGSPVGALEAPGLGARLAELAVRVRDLGNALDIQLTKMSGRIDALAAAVERRK